MKPLVRKAAQLYVAANVWVYRQTNGRVGGRGMGDLPVLLLTVPGRKSGVPHTVPIAYIDHDDNYLVVGTGMGGSRQTPQWFLNLKPAGTGHVRIREQEHDVDARLPADAELAELWSQVAARAPHFAKWQVRTGRTFPVAVLTTRSSLNRTAAASHA
jgi:deazaflavin-dependent oxidoreductase (nitroreductase family)